MMTAAEGLYEGRYDFLVFTLGDSLDCAGRPLFRSTVRVSFGRIARTRTCTNGRSPTLTRSPAHDAEGDR